MGDFYPQKWWFIVQTKNFDFFLKEKKKIDFKKDFFREFYKKKRR